MSLGANVSYTPFNKVSFGYTNIINADYSGTFQNATDIVIVEITYVSGPFDDESHISTPSSGSAISTYDKDSKKFRVKGQKSDVDAVLNQLAFYPSPDGYNVNWSVSTSDFIDYTTQQTETPPTIQTTQLRVRVLNGTTEVANVTKDMVPVQPSYVYYRPYMTTLPPSESVALNTDTTLDFGEFGDANMADRNFTITVEVYSSISPWQYSNPSYASFDWDELYVGDKRPTTPNSNEILKFTGNIDECMACLENAVFTKTQASTFYLRIRVTDGIGFHSFSKEIT